VPRRLATDAPELDPEPPADHCGAADGRSQGLDTGDDRQALSAFGQMQKHGSGRSMGLSA
jgi:hypothetical protein